MMIDCPHSTCGETNDKAIGQDNADAYEAQKATYLSVMVGLRVLWSFAVGTEGTENQLNGRMYICTIILN